VHLNSFVKINKLDRKVFFVERAVDRVFSRSVDLAVDKGAAKFSLLKLDRRPSGKEQ
jgi:hypothetical protein